jgi:serine/threonine protein kinase
MTAPEKTGRYEITGELGRGAMGVVYKAKDPAIGRAVAVKTIRLSEEGTGMTREDLLRRFQIEARAAGLLAHPNIVVVYDVGEENGLYYITMEMVEGRSLLSILDSKEKIGLPRAIKIIEQACAALQFAHERNVIHRDIKPANLMITKDDTVKITDFGTAKIMQHGSGVQATSVIGTPSYMSPEQVKGKAVNGRTDIFSLGVVFYQMVTGEKPFHGQDIASTIYKILNEIPIEPQLINRSLPPAINDLILRMLAKEPENRYPSCKAILEDLHKFAPVTKPAPAPVAASVPMRSASAPPADSIPPNPTPPGGEKKPHIFKVDMPRIPGVEPRPESSSDPAHETPHVEERAPELLPEPSKKLLPEGVAPLIAGALGFAVLVVIGFSIAKRNVQGTQSAPVQTEQAQEEQGQLPSSTGATDVSPSSVKQPPMPNVASIDNPEIAKTSEIDALWSSKKFFFRGETSSAYIPSIIVRLPGAASQSSSYWAFSLDVPFGKCKFEYVQDLAVLADKYGVKTWHPMVVNPCSQSVFDPLNMKEMPGKVLVRGKILAGLDVRPPYGIELRVRGNSVQALRVE